MNKTGWSLCRFLVMLCCLGGNIVPGLGQLDSSQSAQIVERIMAAALARCYSKVDGVARITFESPTDQEYETMKGLGAKAVTPLAKYLDVDQKDGFTQLFAVKFLVAIDRPDTFGPLTRAFGQDQWEATRAAALAGMFAVSKIQAKPFVKLGLTD